MNRIFLVPASLTAILLALLFYRSCASSNRLNVDPHAAEEIEKAKRR
jgi:hypothetical protein